MMLPSPIARAAPANAATFNVSLGQAATAPLSSSIARIFGTSLTPRASEVRPLEIQ